MSDCNCEHEISRLERDIDYLDGKVRDMGSDIRSHDHDFDRVFKAMESMRSEFEDQVYAMKKTIEKLQLKISGLEAPKQRPSRAVKKRK